MPTIRAVTDADGEIKYEYKAEVVLRGTEARVYAQMQTEGWELVREKPGILRTQLMFRRPKLVYTGNVLSNLWMLLRTRSEARVWAGLIGVMVVCGVVIGVGAAIERGGDTYDGAGGGSVTATPAADVRTSEPTATPTIEPVVVETESAPKILTRKNNEDLAALLKDSHPAVESAEQFAAEYEGRTIRFVATITDLALHGDYDTRYDILLIADGPHQAPEAGPYFKFEDVNTVYDLHYISEDVPDSIGLGDRVRITAKVDRYDSLQSMFFLEPESTEFL
jgi:hypothetical protein